MGNFDIDWHAVLWAALITFLAWPRVTEFGRGLRDGWNEATRGGGEPPAI